MKREDFSDEVTIAASQLAKEGEYWHRQLAGNLVKSCFSRDYQRETSARFHAEPLRFKISPGLYSSLMRLSGSVDPLLFVILAAGLAALLYKYTGNRDIIFGIPINRQEKEGDFINTVLTLRNRLDPGMTFKELLLQVKKTIIAALENQNYPIETLLNRLNLPFSAAANDFPLFDVVILLENIHEKKYIMPVRPNIIISFSREETCLEGVLEFNPSLYEIASIERIIDHYCRLLTAVLGNTDGKVSAVDLLSEQERQELVFDFNAVESDYPKGKTLHELVEDQVEKTPDHIAVVSRGSSGGTPSTAAAGAGSESLTYRELNKESHGLAALLRQKGVKADTLVGIMMDRSLRLIVGILGILKAGGAFLPIDGQAPKKRIMAIMEDSRASILLIASLFDSQRPLGIIRELLSTGAEPLVTARRPPVTDLDQLPIPDRSLVDYEKYQRNLGFGHVKDSISIQATRGCPYKCAYCHKIWPKTHVFRSAQQIFAEVNLYYRMGVRRFVFVDDIFNLDKKNSSKFFELVIREGLDARFFFPNGLRVDLMTEEYIDLMIKAGTVMIAFPLETASPRLQTLVGKNLDLEKFRKNIEYVIRKYPHVIVDLYCMHGFPTETEEEAMMTLDFMMGLEWLHFPAFVTVRIFRDTDMARLALENGISAKAIAASESLAYLELPGTLPFDKNFSLKCQTVFLNNYLLLKERLLAVLPHQLRILGEEALVEKYNSYLPFKIKGLPDLLRVTGIQEEELGAALKLKEDYRCAPGLNRKLKEKFPKNPPLKGALKILLLDLTQFFSHDVGERYFFEVVEAPLGLICLLTYLNRQLGAKVNGKIAKSRLDFNSYSELKTLLAEFKPDLIGLRTLSHFKNFFHHTAAMMRQWGVDVPIIAGGPYATSDYKGNLQDKNIDLVVLGEGEITFCELVEKIIAHKGKLPPEEVLRQIPGLAFIPAEIKASKKLAWEPVLLDTTARTADSAAGEKAPAPGTRPAHLAYTIYTSGSTGKPRGVLLEHQSAVNYTCWAAKNYIGPGPVYFPLFTPLSFDLTITSIFTPLITGNTVLVYGEDDNVTLVEKIVAEDRVGVVKLTPSHLKLLVETQKKDKNKASGLKRLIVGGEELETALAANIYRHFNGGIEIFNEYGPTEATVGCMIHRYDPGQDKRNSVPIGRPIDNTQIFILDKNKKPLPLGIVGELYISGAGLARGYLNNPGLTAEKFCLRQPGNHSTLYKTGDLARWIPGQEIEFLGRSDDQVKIRGYRIELEEISRLLVRHTAVKEAVALAAENYSGEKRLVAYIVPDAAQAFTVNRLLHLEKRGVLSGQYIHEVANMMPFISINQKETEFLYQEIFTNRLYVKHGITLSDGACVFDVGANIGMFAIFLNHILKDVEIHAFEPIAPVYDILCLNTELYGVKGKNYSCGLGRFTGETVFTYYPNASLLSGSYPNTAEEMTILKQYIRRRQETGYRDDPNVSEENIDRLLEERLSQKELICPLNTLSQIIRQNNIEKIDLLKIAVEKGEVDVLNGIDREDWPKIKQLVIEVHNTDGRLEKITRQLEQLGYHTAVKQDRIFQQDNNYHLYARRQPDNEVQPARDSKMTKTGLENKLSHRWYSPKQLKEELENYLAEGLPGYMVPSALVMMAELPLTPNGKLDKKALPAPETAAREKYVAPRNEIENRLVEIWSDILGVNKQGIGIDSNFFEMGGDSIKSIRVASRLQKYNMRLEINHIFDNPTIRELAIHIKEKDRKIDQAVVRGDVVLTPIQRWFFDTFTGNRHCNQAVMIYSKHGFHGETVQTVFQKITQHHDALRMVFNFSEEKVIQRNRGVEGQGVDIEILDLAGYSPAEVEQGIENEANRLQRAIDLTTGPLVKLALFRTGEGDHLLMVIHHLVVDGVSWRILLEDFAAGYRQALRGEEIVFQDKTDSFQKWAQELAAYAQTREPLKELSYWKEVELTETPALPRDDPPEDETHREQGEGQTREMFSIGISPQDTDIFLTGANHAYTTQAHDLLLTALGLTLNQWAGLNRILIGLEGHGREDIINGIDVTRTVGWFTTQFPVVLDLGAADDLSLCIKTVKETLRKIPRNGIGYGILKHLVSPGKKQGFRFPKEPEIGFNYLGQMDQEFRQENRDNTVTLSKIKTGDSINPNNMMNRGFFIDAYVVAGTLQLVFYYDRTKYRAKTLRELAEGFKKNLLAILRHCMSKEEKELTPSDVSEDAELSGEELEEIQQYIDLYVE